MEEIFLSWIRIMGSSMIGLHALRIGHEVGRQVATIELHSLDGLEGRVLRPLRASSTVITPSFPTFSMASAIKFADLRVAVGRDRADLSRFLLLPLVSVDRSSKERLRTGLDSGLSMPRRIPIGFVPAVTFFRPSKKIACAKNRSRSRAVAGHVGCLRGDLLHHLGAHVLHRVFQLHSPSPRTHRLL